MTYHGVVPPGYQPIDGMLDGNLVTAHELRRQLRFLKSRYNVLQPEDVLAWREGGKDLPERAVLLTCDDGLLNHLTCMAPILREENVSCLFFVTGASCAPNRTMLWYEELFLLFLRSPSGFYRVSCDGFVADFELGSTEQRGALWWSYVKSLSTIDTQLRRNCLDALEAALGSRPLEDLSSENSSFMQRFGLLTAGEVSSLSAAGMTIGAHTMSHPMLSQCSPGVAQSEIAECRERLESIENSRVWAFAYPFGDAQSVTPEVLELPEAAGYTAAFMNHGGGLGADLRPFALPRIHVTAQTSLAELEAHVSGFYSGLHRRLGRSA
ncbi:MAG TPA: polysaccharide deacetylase family protein [Candidatus Solibacter sp.]|nr:polysaccharide deacetylase family protein [Candidatus Solibacter sp.]